MRIYRARLSVLLLALTAALAVAPSSFAQTKPRRAAQTAPAGGTVIFAVEKYEQGEPQIEPVVLVSQGRFTAPPVDGDEAVARRAKKFIGDYFRAGRQFRLLFGGGEAGTASVSKYLEPGCTGMIAEVKLQTSVRVGGEVHALATDSDKLGRGESSRRAPTEAERAAALELARTTYRAKGVAAALVKKMETVNLTATDLDRDGRAELVGSFQTVAADYTNHSLFIIFEPAGTTFKPALVWFHRGAEAEAADRRLIDQLDLDGDGTAEVIAEGHYYESNDYIIYKKQQGRWSAVYQGGGGGC